MRLTVDAIVALLLIKSRVIRASVRDEPHLAKNC